LLKIVEEIYPAHIAALLLVDPGEKRNSASSGQNNANPVSLR
jgi:hypothetical protein